MDKNIVSPLLTHGVERQMMVSSVTGLKSVSDYTVKS